MRTAPRGLRVVERTARRVRRRPAPARAAPWAAQPPAGGWSAAPQDGGARHRRTAGCGTAGRWGVCPRGGTGPAVPGGWRGCGGGRVLVGFGRFSSAERAVCDRGRSGRSRPVAYPESGPVAFGGGGSAGSGDGAVGKGRVALGRPDGGLSTGVTGSLRPMRGQRVDKTTRFRLRISNPGSLLTVPAGPSRSFREAGRTTGVPGSAAGAVEAVPRCAAGAGGAGTAGRAGSCRRGCRAGQRGCGRAGTPGRAGWPDPPVARGARAAAGVPVGVGVRPGWRPPLIRCVLNRGCLSR